MDFHETPHFARRFWDIRRIILPFNKASLEAAAILIQIILAVIYAWSYNFMANHTGDVLTAVVSQNRSYLFAISKKIFLAAILGAVVNSVILSIGDILCHQYFRNSLTEKIMQMYIQDHAYYRLLYVSRGINDPDVRIANDVNALCEKLKLILFGTPMYVGYITTTATVAYFTATLVSQCGWFVPCAVYVVFIISSIVSRLLSSGPSKASRRLADSNSACLTQHTHFATHAEHIAFLRGELDEALKLSHSLSATFPNVRKAALLHFPLNAWTMLFWWGSTFYAYFIPGLAWLWLDDTRYTDYTHLVNVSTVAVSLFTTLTTYLLLSEEFSGLVAVTWRVGEFMDELRSCPERKKKEQHVTLYDSGLTGEIELRNVTLYRPNGVDGDGDVMIRDIALRVCRGSSIVIMGPSGIGKTSLLRVIAGLWPASGSIRRPMRIGRNGVMFVPQKPYLTTGSLRSQIMYPEESADQSAAVGAAASAASHDGGVKDEETRLIHGSSSFDSAPKTIPVTISPTTHSSSDVRLPIGAAEKLDVRSLLAEVDLEYLCLRYDPSEVHDWGHVLSVGEQQRLGIARVLFHEPSIAVMDEATSAIDEQTEEKVFVALTKRNIALLSVAHRSTVAKYHQHVLRISRDGSWVMGDVWSDVSDHISSPLIGTPSTPRTAM